MFPKYDALKERIDIAYGNTKIENQQSSPQRRAAVRTGRQGQARGQDTHKPPHVADVPNLVTECVDWVNRERAHGRHEIECAAYAMWRLNWIHPFRGGNGRTSRMVAYLILCLALGHMMPGQPSIPTLIEQRRDDYIVALRACDDLLVQQVAASVDEPIAAIAPMIAFLQPMVEAQMLAGVREGEAR